jgi:hypothetical protein
MKIDEKRGLIHSMGMKYDEAVELFSYETLGSMSMSHVVGGDDPSQQTYCSDSSCGGSGGTGGTGSSGGTGVSGASDSDAGTGRSGGTNNSTGDTTDASVQAGGCS